jgi:hypothetical protein
LFKAKAKAANTLIDSFYIFGTHWLQNIPEDQISALLQTKKEAELL